MNNTSVEQLCRSYAATTIGWPTRVCCHTLTKPDCLAPLQNSTKHSITKIAPAHRKNSCNPITGVRTGQTDVSQETQNLTCRWMTYATIRRVMNADLSSWQPEWAPHSSTFPVTPIIRAVKTEVSEMFPNNLPCLRTTCDQCCQRNCWTGVRDSIKCAEHIPLPCPDLILAELLETLDVIEQTKLESTAPQTNNTDMQLANKHQENMDFFFIEPLVILATFAFMVPVAQDCWASFLRRSKRLNSDLTKRNSSLQDHSAGDLGISAVRPNTPVLHRRGKS